MEEKRILEFESGHTIFAERDKGDEMYILLEGEVELTKKVEKGRTLLKSVNDANDFFGEMALIDESPRSATAIAVKPTKLLAIKQPAFEKLILENPNFALKIIKILSARIRSSNRQISELSTEIPKERIRRGMVDFALREGKQIFNKGYAAAIKPMVEWVNGHLGLSKKDIENEIYRLLKVNEIRYAASKDHPKQAIILPPAFIERYKRQ